MTVTGRLVSNIVMRSWRSSELRYSPISLFSSCIADEIEAAALIDAKTCPALRALIALCNDSCVSSFSLSNVRRRSCTVPMSEMIESIIVFIANPFACLLNYPCANIQFQLAVRLSKKTVKRYSHIVVGELLQRFVALDIRVFEKK